MPRGWRLTLALRSTWPRCGELQAGWLLLRTAALFTGTGPSASLVSQLDRGEFSRAWCRNTGDWVERWGCVRHGPCRLYFPAAAERCILNKKQDFEKGKNKKNNDKDDLRAGALSHLCRHGLGSEGPNVPLGAGSGLQPWPSRHPALLPRLHPSHCAF